MSELEVRLPEAVLARTAKRAIGIRSAQEGPSVAEVERIYRQGARDEVIARAIVDGKFAGTRADAYRQAWDASPAATRAQIARLEPVIVAPADARPTLEAVVASFGRGKSGDRS